MARPWTSRTNLLLAAASVLGALALGEGALRLAGLPAEHRPHGRDPQFVPVNGADFLYTNVPSAGIRFTYDDNPRGYFGPGNEIVHHTNSHGFRGAPFSVQKPTDTVRFLFLGDSFTFGEGVKDEDTYAEQFQRLVVSRQLFSGKKVEVLNLGVGGYNTTQEAALLRQFGVVLSPDFVVVAYCLNDAEPDLYQRTPDGGWARRQRGAEVAEDVATPEVPSPLSFLRLTRLAYLAWSSPQLTARTIAHYRSLYTEGSPDWARTQGALGEIARLCRERNIPVTVVIFPVFFHLKGDYPFQDLHRELREVVEGRHMSCVDLYPVFREFIGPELWVHPSDQHPNEIAHRMVAERLAEVFESSRRSSRP